MNRRNFVTRASAVALGLSIPALAFAKAGSSPALAVEEERLLGEFRQLLASYSSGEAITDNLTTVRKINRSVPGVLDFQDSNDNRISLRKVKGRLVARLH